MRIGPHADNKHRAYIYPVQNGGGFSFDLITHTGEQKNFRGGGGEEIRRAASRLLAALDGLPQSVLNAEEMGERVPDEEIASIRDAGRGLADALLVDVEEFRSFLRSKEIDLVVIGSDCGELRFPWALLHTGSEWFGEIAMFSRTRPASTVVRSAANDREARPMRIGYAEDDQLESSHAKACDGAEDELRIIRSFSETAQFDQLPPLTPGPLQEHDRSVFEDWLATSRSFVHFNAHQEAEDEQGMPSMRLSRKASASSGHVSANISVHSPVILNVCSSGTGVHGDSRSFAARFRSRGSPAICSTSGTVTDRFATAFARTLYEEANVADLNIFRAIRSAQRRLLEETGHPMSLLYVFEGDPEQALAR